MMIMGLIIIIMMTMIITRTTVTVIIIKSEKIIMVTIIIITITISLTFRTNTHEKDEKKITFMPVQIRQLYSVTIPGNVYTALFLMFLSPRWESLCCGPYRYLP